MPPLEIHAWRYDVNHLVAHFWITDVRTLCRGGNSALQRSNQPLRGVASWQARCGICAARLRDWHTTPPYTKPLKAHDLGSAAAAPLLANALKLQSIMLKTAPFRYMEAYWKAVAAEYGDGTTAAAVKELARRYKLTSAAASCTVFVRLAYGFVCACGDGLAYSDATSVADIERWIKAHSKHKRAYRKNS